MGAVVTAEHVRRALSAGACDEVPEVGTPIQGVPFSSLCWAEDHEIVSTEEAREIATEVAGNGAVPLWALAGSGYGYGYGSGSGYGYGYGSGSGYGYGYGYGSGSGYGYGE